MTISMVEAPGQIDADPLGIAGIAAAIAHNMTVTSALWPNQPAEHATERTGVRVLSRSEYDVWLLRWPKGTSVTPHDHGPSVGALCVVRGALRESRWHGGKRTERVVGRAESLTIGCGVVHDVIGVTDGSLSVHVYAPPLSLMRFYDEDGIVMVRSETVDVADDREGPGAGLRTTAPTRF